MPLHRRSLVVHRSVLILTKPPFYRLPIPPRLFHSSARRTMASPGLSKEQFQLLRKYTACDVADALLRLKVPGAGFLPDLNLYPARTDSSDMQTTIAPASTVLFVSKSNPDKDITDHHPAPNIPAGKHYVDLTQPGTIVVMSQPEGQKNACLGGIMALRMKVVGAEGIVVSGRVRDVGELGSTGLPIWARATSIVGAGADAKQHAVQVPLVIDSTRVRPGDLVFSDPENGVVVIPLEKLDEVVDLLPQLVEADDRVKNDVERGISVQEAFKKHRG